MKPALILLALLGAFTVAALNAQTVQNPAPMAAACAYNTSPPTVSTGQFVLLQCDSTGQIRIAP